MKIDPARSALLVVDVQDRLWAVMSQEDRAVVLKNITILAELARRLRLPVVLSEQNPSRLGPTVPELLEALPEHHRLEKMEFSAAAAPAFAPIQVTVARDTWIVCGMETHICVYQTARDLVARGAAVHVVADAVISRTRENRTLGLELIRRAGGVVTPTETVVFDALGAAGSDDFRVMSRLVK